MRVAIVLPTMPGRERVFDATLAAYEATRPKGWEFDLTIPEGYASVGEAWNAGAHDVEGDYYHFAVDDAAPLPGWCEAAVEWTSDTSLPSPRVVFPDGRLDQCGSMGGGMLLPECPTGTPCRSAPFPFVSERVWHSVGEFLPIHYYSDDDFYWRAELHGAHTYVVREYAFVHDHQPTPRIIALSDAHQLLFRENAARQAHHEGPSTSPRVAMIA